jgi:hypothetical protein
MGGYFRFRIFILQAEISIADSKHEFPGATTSPPRIEGYTGTDRHCCSAGMNAAADRREDGSSVFTVCEIGEFRCGIRVAIVS